MVKPLGLMARLLIFFIKFRDVLGADLVEVFNSSYQDSFLPSSACKGIIILLFKKMIGWIARTGDLSVII